MVQLLVLAGLAAIAGCGPKGTRMNLVTYNEAGQANAHYTDFAQAYFKRQSDGRIDLVFESCQPSRVDPTQMITQIVHVQSFWTPQPGRTYVESSQVNARMQYAILTPPTGLRYDGGGFVTYKIDKRTGEAVGYVESGDLAPAYRMGDAVEPFGPAKIYGHFRARENPGNVVDAIQQLRNQFTVPAEAN